MTFIWSVEEEVLEHLQRYCANPDKYSRFPDVWVHYESGKVLFDDYPETPGYVKASADKLCSLDRNLARQPDKKAVKKWIEEKVLMHVPHRPCTDWQKIPHLNANYL